MTTIGQWPFTAAALALAALLGAGPATARDVAASWDQNSESNLRGYKIYFGLDPRGCALAPHNSAFRYQDAPALQGQSPIVIFEEDLLDPSAPQYRLLGLPDDMPLYLSVTAVNTGGAESMFSGEAALNDDAGPQLCDANAPTSTSVRVTFSEFVAQASASNASNYTLTDGSGAAVNITAVTYDDTTFRHVTLQTASLVQGSDYVLSVDNVEDFFDGNAIESGASAQFRYTRAPVLRSVKVLNPNSVLDAPRIEVEFSEAVSSTTASDISNYSVNSGSVAVTLARMAIEIQSSDHQRSVYLTLGELLEGASYTLSADGVEDTAEGGVAVASEIDFFVPEDNLGPEIVSVHVTNPLNDRMTLKAVFDEQVDDATVSQLSNFDIAPGISVQDTSLFGDGRTVVLETTEHPDGDYELMVDGIDDRAEVPNTMATALLDYTVIDNVTDSDDDGDVDSLDNCTTVPNADQRDTDDDGFGNACDSDLDNNGVVNTLDLARFRSAFGTLDGDPQYSPEADFNGDGVVNTLDLGTFRSSFGGTPGPSCCAG